MSLKWTAIIFILTFYGCATTKTNRAQTTESQQFNQSSEKNEYEKARQIDSVEMYDELLVKYPTSNLKDSVIYYRDRSALNKAKKNGTPEAFQEFLNKYPDSDWADQARYFKKYGVIKEVNKKNDTSGGNDKDSKQYTTFTNDGFVRDWVTSEEYTSQSSHESFKAEVLKIFSAKKGDALFRVYVVKWKGQEVIADDPLVLSDYKVGDTATVLMMDLPYPDGKANKRLLNFTIMPTPEPFDREKALKELNELEKTLGNNK